MKIKSFACGAAVVVALFASAHFASAYPVQLDVDLNCSFSGVWDCSGINVFGGEGDCSEGYLAETGGGTITIEVDLPAGTFDVSGTPGPGDIYGPGPTVDINDGSSSVSGTGIVGPTTVYVSFLNQGAAITRAAGISISGEATTPTEVCADLNCSFSGVTDCSGISIHGGEGDCSEGYLAETGGGTITIEVDLPAGTFDVSGTPGPGDIYGPGPTVDITDGSSSITGTGISGPTTVYVLFLNQGAAITRAAGVCVSRY